MHRIETKGDGNTIFFEMGIISSSITQHPKIKNKSCVHKKNNKLHCSNNEKSHTWFHLKKQNSIKKIYHLTQT